MKTTPLRDKNKNTVATAAAAPQKLHENLVLVFVFVNNILDQHKRDQCVLPRRQVSMIVKQDGSRQ